MSKALPLPELVEVSNTIAADLARRAERKRIVAGIRERANKHAARRTQEGLRTAHALRTEAGIIEAEGYE